MIENLKSDEVINRFGGRFKLAGAIQKRWLELMQGARPLIGKPAPTQIETAIEEFLEGRIDVEYEMTRPDLIQQGPASSSGPTPGAKE